MTTPRVVFLFPGEQAPGVFVTRIDTFAVQSLFMSILRQLSEYLYLRKKDPDRPKSKWIGYMHGINRISLLIFILCLVILAIKLLT